MLNQRKNNTLLSIQIEMPNKRLIFTQTNLYTYKYVSTIYNLIQKKNIKENQILVDGNSKYKSSKDNDKQKN